MGTLGGIQRPLFAAAAAAIASVSVDLSNKFTPSCALETSSSSSQKSSATTCDCLQESSSSWVAQVSLSKLSELSFVNKIRVPLPRLTNNQFISLGSGVHQHLASSVASSPFLVSLYQSAELAKAQPTAYKHTLPASASDISYRWHLPKTSAFDTSANPDCSSAKTKTVVVLLGWLGAKQKHMRRYADWYTSRGFHVITFTFPMSEILSYQIGGKAEQQVDSLVVHLADWMEENEKSLIFHTFSNTGWLTYGVILEKFLKQDPSLISRIRGCIVDSAPVAAPDPQVWASGFSAAFLKKQSVATKGSMIVDSTRDEIASPLEQTTHPAAMEAALLVVLERFFEVVLNLPKVNRRLSDVLGLLTIKQPSCPQLYIYSSADRVIPAASVESFIEAQRKNGHEVRACNFVSTPHVDHYRNQPNLYTSQLTQFLEDCVLSGCKNSS
uniref:Transmembrane protein 53 n=1 Tax=Kalanchoe fedtschenkoi TaxID=63787 RepID=A0A7N0TPI3_KALFE